MIILKKPKQFRSFVTNQYWANKDEYHAMQQEHPYTFEEYVRNNLKDLKEGFKQAKIERKLAVEDECECYGCTTMRHPCVKEIG